VLRSMDRKIRLLPNGAEIRSADEIFDREKSFARGERRGRRVARSSLGAVNVIIERRFSTRVRAFAHTIQP